MTTSYGTISPPSIIIVNEDGARTAYAASTDDETSDGNSYLTLSSSESNADVIDSPEQDNIFERAIVRVLGRPLPSLRTFKLIFSPSDQAVATSTLEERIRRYEEDDAARALRIISCCVFALPFVGLVVYAIYLIISRAVPGAYFTRRVEFFFF